MVNNIGEERGQDVRWWWFAAAVLPFVLLSLVQSSRLPAPEVGDYAQYILHAQALSEGRPYHDIGYLYSPHGALIGPKVQPPGWPLLLVPVVKFAGTGFVLPTLLMNLLGVLFLMWVVARFARAGEVALGACAAALVGVALRWSPTITAPLSDLPFCAMVWAVILVADRNTPLTWRRASALGVLTGYAAMSRVAGVALVPAVALLALVRPLDRRALFSVVGVFALGAAGALSVFGLDSVPFARLILRAPSLVDRAWANALLYRLPVLDVTLYPFPWDRANDAYHLLALGLMAVGVPAFLRRFGRSFLGVLLVPYGAMLLVAPVADQRYLWPLWPVVAYLMFAGARTVLAWVPRVAPHAERIVLGGTTVLCLGGIMPLALRPAGPSLLGNPDVQDVMRWVSTAPDRASMRVVFISPRVMTLETGVPAMGIFNAPDSIVLNEYQRVGITHLIGGDAGTGHPAWARVDALVQANPTLFVPVHRNPSFTVYRLPPEAWGSR